MVESSGLSEDEVLVLNAGIVMLSTVVLAANLPVRVAVWRFGTRYHQTASSYSDGTGILKERAYNHT